jgi:hypothetical protein
MATPTKGPDPIRQKARRFMVDPLDQDTSGDPLFDVVVEHKIGTVRIGSGKESPFTTAMILIGRHHENETEDATYRFPGAREGEELTVRLEHTWPVDRPDPDTA